MKTGQKTGLWWRVLAFAGALVLAFSGGNVAQAAPLVGEVTTPEAWINLTSGDDATGDGSQEKPFKTVAKAQQVLGTGGGTLHVSGTQEGITASVVVNSKFVLDVATNTVFSGTAQPVLRFSTGSSVQSTQGAILTVTNTVDTNNALQVDKGATVGDGIYKVNGTFTENGTVLGSARQNLQVTVQGKMDMRSEAPLSHATIKVTDRNNNGFKFCPVADDISFTSSGMNVNTNCNTTIKNSDVSISDSVTLDSFEDTIAVNSYGIVNVENSVLTLNGGRLSLQPGAVWTFTGSQLIVQDSNSGVLHVNQNTTEKSSATFIDSTITTKNVSFYGPTIGSGSAFRTNQNGAELTFRGNSVVNTAASGTDAIGKQNGAKLVVLGGSYMVNPANTTTTTANPTNGAEHGDETLTYFRLANPAEVSSINIRDLNGVDYTYPVAKASSDGNKYVWAPTQTVTYQLDNPTASFAGGGQKPVTQRVIRGGSAGLTDMVSGKSEAFPQAPTDADGKSFLGWVNAETGEPFTAATQVTKDVTVRALWEGQVDARVIYYPNVVNPADSPVRIKVDPAAAKAATLSEVQALSDAFSPAHRTFIGWATQPDGGEIIEPGASVTLQEGELKLYAQWKVDKFTVKFSANGGTFSDTSPFKGSAKDNFTIEKDASGGEVAVYKEKVEYGKTFDALGVGDDFTAKATRTYYKLTSGYKDGTTYWFTSADNAASTTATSVGSLIEGDTTLYLHWKKNLTKTASKNFKMPAATSIAPGKVKLQNDALLVGDTATVSAEFQLPSLAENVKSAFAEAYSGEDVAWKDVTLTDTTLTFKVVINFPDSLGLPDGFSADNVSAVISDSLQITDVSATAKTATVTLATKLRAANAEDLFAELQGLNIPEARLDFSGVNVIQSAKTAKVIANVTAKFDVITDTPAPADSGTAAGGSNGLAFASPLAFLSFMEVGGTEDVSAAGRGVVVNWAGTDSDETPNEVSSVFTAVVPAPMGTDGLPLNANILLNHSGTSEDRKVVMVQPGDAVEWIGQLDVKSIQEKIQLMSNYYCSTDQDECAQMLGNTVSDFVVTLALPKGLLAPADLTADQLGFNSNGLFKVASVSVENPALSSGTTAAPGAVDNGGQIVRIKLSLAKEGSASTQNYNTFKELLDDVLAENPLLEAHVPTTVASDVATGVNLTGTGTVTGNFSAVVIKDGQVQKWNFGWNGVQDAAAGKADEAAPTAIAATVGVMPSASQLDLPADLVIATAGEEDQSTQNTAVRYVKRGAQYDYTGVLDVKSIKQKIAALGSALASCDASTQDCADAYSSISLQDVASGFTGVLTLPAGVTPPASVDPAAVRFPENDLFEVTSVTVEGQKVTIVTTLKKNYDNFNSLYEDVQSVPDTLTLTLPNALVASDLTSENQLKATGEITGDFQGVAHRNDNWMYFSFAWMGKQISGKGDSTCDSDACKNDITLTVAPKLRDIAVTKNWVGVDAASAPAVEVNITAPDESEPKQNLAAKKLTLNSAGEWTGKFEKLDWYEADGVTEIAYVPAELTLNGYTTAVSGDMKTGFTITNTRNMQTLSVTKQWEGVPSSDTAELPEVTVNLVENGVKSDKSVVLNADNGYTSSFEVPVTAADGSAIDYTVEETPINGYTSEVSGDVTDGFTITNTRAMQTLSVTKQWEGVPSSDTTPLPEVTVYLVENGVKSDKSVVLNADNGYTSSFEVPVATVDGTNINYSVSENAVAGYSGAVTGNATDGFTITNTLNTVDVKVKKKWEGVAAEDAPAVTVTLLADGEALEGKTIVLSQENEWTGTFTGLPATKADGVTAIEYTVAEEPVAGYEGSVSVTEDGVLVLNKRVQRTVSVTKKWVGVAEGASTPEVTINLLADGEKIDSVKLNSENGYAGSFVAPLSTPRGNNIIYTVAEDAVAGFKSEVTGDAETGFTVTNTRVTEPAPAPQPERPADKTLSVTGGSNAVPLLVGGLLLAGAATCGVLAWRRRKQA